MSEPAKLAYLVMRFPAVTETFILREIVELERQGMPIDLYVVIKQDEEVVHPDAVPYIDRMHTVSLSKPAVWGANLLWLLRRPFRYVGLFIQMLVETFGTWNFLFREIIMFPQAAYFARQMEKNQITHVHTHYATHTAFATYVIHRLTGISYSFTAHAHDIYIRRAMLCRKIRFSTFVATISNFNKKLMMEECGADVGDKIHVVRCGVSPDEFRSRAHHGEAGVFKILTVASLRDYKGIPYLIEACALARDRIPHLQWEVIGGGPDRKQLEALIEQRGVGDIFKLAGPQPTQVVAERMQQTDVFVMGSIIMPDMRMEGIPVVLMESLATELPTIATRISGIPELVIDGDTGYLAPERDPQAIADFLVEIYNDPEEGARRGRSGRQRVLDEFTIEGNVTRLRGIFEAILY